MIGEIENVKIQGIAAAVPEYHVDNTDFASVLGERRLKKQVRLTGVKKRHLALKRQHTSDLCISASRKLIKHLDWDVKDIKILVLVTQSATFDIPSTAFFIQNKLGIPSDCVCFDINLGCSSVDNGIQVVGSLLQTFGKAAKALLLVGDTAGRPFEPGYQYNPDVIADRILFGSAGAAIAMEYVPGETILYQNESDGEGYEAIISHKTTHVTRMDGERVYEFATTKVVNSLKQFKKHFGIQENQVDYYVFHQAQKLILDMITMDSGISEDKELRSVEEYGNTSGNSVIVSICANEHRLPKDRELRFVMTGFGVGLSWGSIYASIPGNNILAITETDEYDDLNRKEEKEMFQQTVVFFTSQEHLEISRFLIQALSEQSARIILCHENAGEREEQLKDLFYPCTGVSNLLELRELTETEKLLVTGVVGFDSNLRQMSELSTLLDLSGCNGFVVLQDMKECSAKEASLKDELLVDAKRIRVPFEELEMINLLDGGQDWMNKISSAEEQLPVKKALALSDSVQYLISDASKYIEKTEMVI